MNTISKIENALKSIDQSTFQRLINHLLYLQGNKFISAPGGVVGKEKTSKGTPDSFFYENDKYLFVECTTKERVGKSKSFFEKLSKDIDHCFKEESTKIKKEDIQKVLLACNEKIDVDEHKLLNEKVKSYNYETEFEILNIQNLPIKIFEIPKLAAEYLNIEIIKGDIFLLQDFLLKTKKGIQPSLTNEFIGREVEIKKCLETLERVDYLFLTGGQGVGKSKLAVKILEELSIKDYVPIVIQSSGVSLWDDYHHLFMPNKKYVILFDDANKSISNLNYLLNRIEALKSSSVKVIITSRDYVKKEVSNALSNYNYDEQNISEFKDEGIEKIILKELPNVKNRRLIKKMIVDLAKGNPRVALMATYSITPNSETNYLTNPVLLYEKYFEKISEEIDIFNEVINLQAIAIVSFFGVLDRNNENIKMLLGDKFNIDWNELWTAILNLHRNEILNVYSNEIVKVSDQVLATYAFYKCFLDLNSSIINYSEWIENLTESHSHRIRVSLVDVNNTFSYPLVKDLVLPHLNDVLSKIHSDNELYSFYELFWFYKGLDCLLYLKSWIVKLSPNEEIESNGLDFGFNDYGKPTKYFELLKNFWSSSTELLKPSLELTLQLLEKQPNRLPEIIKNLIDGFKYKYDDVDRSYKRQNILLDVLCNENIPNIQKNYANELFLELAEVLLGWHYTEFVSSKGNAFTVLNFDLYKSETLMKFRKRILDHVYLLFDVNNDRFDKILNKIIHPGALIDKEIYVEEASVYQTIISHKLDVKRYAHCNFVRALSKKLIDNGAVVPENWKQFTESEIIKISQLLNLEREYRKGKSFTEVQLEKQKQFSEFVFKNDWPSLEQFILTVDIYFHQEKNTRWQITSSLTEIYIAIAKKDRFEFEKALRIFFSGRVSFDLDTRVIFVALTNTLITSDELLKIIDSYDFKGKTYWESVILAMVSTEQINELLLKRLLANFQKNDEFMYVQEMLDYLKYHQAFEEYKEKKTELNKHNIISYLTSIVLNKKHKSTTNFGYNFFSNCVSYFKDFPEILKEAYLTICQLDPQFDYIGSEMKALLQIDKNFINNSLKAGKIGIGYPSTIKLEDINTDPIWETDSYGDLIEDIILTILDLENFSFIGEDDISSIFRFNDPVPDRTEKVKSLILKLTKKHINNKKLVLILIEITYNINQEWFIEYFREFLIEYKNYSIIPNINFERSESWSGSRVPLIQKKIEFYENILDMIMSLPGILDYGEHIKYFEKQVEYKKKEIVNEQKRDFMEEYY
ncbi:hypothetical protein [Sphingobacterium faecium]|uniref:nSTAND3 domain-containing NTPase n=1 Tax=Sphingobacterium faecium TaxID=34087 RepID=UPI002479185A|nr:hypothetical protein [Sphingobacterium faecium]WGQ13783.1 hypothetical protein QG727_17335 [Sphingobacterium faecium]